MNPKSLRAGKAVAETGQSPPLPGIPKILFEGDQPPAEATTPEKFGTGIAHPVLSDQQEAKLPEAYGTGKLLLSARDPHTLFAHWDLTDEQRHRYHSLAAGGQLALRAYAHAISNRPAVEVSVPPEPRHVFLQVERAGASYVGELGYYQPDRKWKTVATSGPATTPPDAPSKETTAVFSTPQALRSNQPMTGGPSEKPLERAGPPIIRVATPRWPFEPEAPTAAESVAAESDFRQRSSDGVPLFVSRDPRKEWTPIQERLLAHIIGSSLERREWISSAEIVELLQRAEQKAGPGEIEWPLLPGAFSNISSPMAGQAGRKGFWFNVSTELIIYGATEPDAQVTIAGRPIQLRADGTFTCHLAMPNGDYALLATAVSPENEQRQAAMNFCRRTNYSGEVGAQRPSSAVETIPQPK
jgi:hypothetical protein